MAELLDTLRGSLDERTIRDLSERVGGDPSAVKQALSAAVPALLGGLSRETRSPEGRASLDRALAQDHDGGLLDQVGSLLSGGAGGLLGGLAGNLLGGGGGGAGRAADGAGILRHVLGDRRDAVEAGAARASGLDRGQVSKLLLVAAPLVMAALGRVKRERNLDEEGVAEAVRGERRELERRAGAADEGDLEGAVEQGDEGYLERFVGLMGGGFLDDPPSARR